jgi:hypothetical protein
MENLETVKVLENQYNTLSLDDKKKVYKAYFSDSTNEEIDEIKRQLKLLIFKEIPPTGEEFLNPTFGWLPKAVTDSIYPHIKEDFLKIIDGGNDYKHLVFYGATRLGKTFLARLLIIYTIIFIHHLREPALFYNLSPLTDLCIYFISFKFDKTRQLYLKPIFKILERSKRFVQVKFQDKVAIEQEKYGCKKIIYSKASTVGEITLSSGLQIILGNDDPADLVGGDILQCYISEIAFFIEKAGAREDEIFRLYTDVYDRIEATSGHNFLSYIYLDSSANYADSLIENHIIKKLQFEKDTYFKWRSRWEARPYLFPIWEKTGETFKVITGNGSIPATLVEHASQLANIPPDLIDNVPIDVRKQYEQNLIKSIKDIGGKPTSNESKFIQNKMFIDSIFDNANLKNILTSIKADAEEIPDNLILKQIEQDLFIRTVDGSLMLQRASKEIRYIGLDLSYSVGGDATGISMVHKEYSTELKNTVYVADFSFSILPRNKAINLEAINDFIWELVTKVKVPVRGVFLDTFYSEALQNLERKKIAVTRQSVDKFIEPYQFLLTLMANNLLKAGRNIYLKNNLFCLQRVKQENGKEKIDHPKGVITHAYDGNWDSSLVGVNAKDVSDSLCQAVWGAKNDDSYIPTTNYEMENRKHIQDKVVQNELIQQALKRVMGI